MVFAFSIPKYLWTPFWIKVKTCQHANDATASTCLALAHFFISFNHGDSFVNGTHSHFGHLTKLLQLLHFSGGLLDNIAHGALNELQSANAAGLKHPHPWSLHVMHFGGLYSTSFFGLRLLICCTSSSHRGHLIYPGHDS